MSATELIKVIHRDYKKRVGKKNAISQQKIADQIGVALMSLSRWFRALERGKDLPPMRPLTEKAVQAYVVTLNK